jgi:thiosulfate dehydrogenase [quinone] large subunit
MNYSKSQLFWLVTLRVLIGWHFLYEGVVKVVNPNWSSIGYLMDSGGFMAGFFQGMAANQSTLQVIDFINIWGLIAIGLGLILGSFTRIATIAGILLLSLYYFSHPPFPGIKYAMPMEGSYLIVNKILIEMVALAVVFLFPTSKEFGLDKFICRKQNKKVE